jgi:hypothetical protein
VVHRQLELARCELDRLRLAAVKTEDLRSGVRRLGAGGDVAWKQLEVVGGRGMVLPEADEPRHDLPAEARRRREPRRTRGLGEVAGLVAQPETAHERLVETGERDVRRRRCGRGGRHLGEPGDEVVESSSCQRRFRLEAGRIPAHQTSAGHQLDLGLRPGLLRLAEHHRGQPQHEERTDRRDREPSHGPAIGAAASHL